MIEIIDGAASAVKYFVDIVTDIVVVTAQTVWDAACACCWWD